MESRGRNIGKMCGALLGCFVVTMFSATGAEPEVRVGKPAPKVWKLPLPASAVLEPKTGDGESGAIPWSFLATSDWFSLRLQQAGWFREIRETISDRKPKSVVMVWAKGDQRLFLMLWEVRVNRTGFRYGREHSSGQPGSKR